MSNVIQFPKQSQLQEEDHLDDNSHFLNALLELNQIQDTPVTLLFIKQVQKYLQSRVSLLEEVWDA